MDKECTRKSFPRDSLAETIPTPGHKVTLITILIDSKSKPYMFSRMSYANTNSHEMRDGCSVGNQRKLELKDSKQAGSSSVPRFYTTSVTSCDLSALKVHLLISSRSNSFNVCGLEDWVRYHRMVFSNPSFVLIFGSQRNLSISCEFSDALLATPVGFDKSR